MLTPPVNRGLPAALWLAYTPAGMYACLCQRVTEADVRRAGRDGLVAPAALVARFGLDDRRCCGRCLAAVEQFVALAWEGADAAAGRPAQPGPAVLVRAPA